MSLNMIVFITQTTINCIKWMLNIKKFVPNLLKIGRKSYKNIGIYNKGNITIKKLMIVKIFTVRILCICLLIMRADISKKKMEINI